MDVIHITETKNIPSIMKYGILRSKPILDQYDKLMARDYGSEYDHNKGLVFGMPEGVTQRDRYIKDFSYWRAWGRNRNIFLDCDYHQYNMYQEIGPKVFSHIKILPIHFSVMLIDIPFHPFYDWYCHAQFNNMGILWSDMDVRYEHDDEPLVLINYDVKPEKIKRVIGTGEAVVGRNKRIDIVLKM